MRPLTLLYVAIFALPAVLLFSSIRTYRELDAQREVYLRERAASIAGRLEAVSSPDEPAEAAVRAIADEEPDVRSLKAIERPSADNPDPAVDAVWSGRALFHTKFVDVNGTQIYRAYVPFHAAGVMHVAEIDLDAAAADFLVVHARHNVLISLAGSVAIVLISLYSIRAARRTAALERRQLELEHLARLGTMSAVLAHEIRNPLGTIKGFVQLAIEQAGNGVRSLLTPVLDQTRRLEALAADLLVYGRPPSPSIRRVAWTELAQRLEAHVHRFTESKPVNVKIVDSALEFDTDPDLLEHVLLNLVRNAVDAAGGSSHGRVEITAGVEGRHAVLIAVSDNGTGIPEKDRPKVTEPFYTTKAFGTGLGLPISIRLTESLGGSLEIAPRAPGGTCATVRLPIQGH